MSAPSAIPKVVRVADFEGRAADRPIHASERVAVHALDARAGAAAGDGPGALWLLLAGSVEWASGDARAIALATFPRGAATHGARLPADARGLAVEPLHAASGQPGDARVVEVDLAGVSQNAFVPLLETPDLTAALVSVAAGRRVDVGPQSERLFTILRGTGLLFFDNGTVLPVRDGDLAVVPAGEAVRVWARGPDDLALVAIQPQAPPSERRTLASEVRRKLAERGG